MLRTIFSLLAFLFVHSLYAGQFVNDVHSARIGALGGLTAAGIHDASALYYNPASLSTQSTNLIFGISPRNSITGYADQNTANVYHQSQGLRYPGFAYLNIKPRKGSLWSASFGYSNLVNFRSSWDTDWPGRFIITDYNTQIQQLAGGISVSINEYISVGANVSYLINRMEFEKQLPFEGASSTFGDFKVNSTESGFSGTLGLTAQVSSNFQLGAVLRTGWQFNHNTDNVVFNLHSAYDPSDSSIVARSAFAVPHSLRVGFAFNANREFTLYGNAEYSLWNGMLDTFSIDFSRNSTFVTDVNEPFLLKSGLSFDIGGEIHLHPSWDWQIGLRYDLKTIPDGHFNPIIPNEDRLQVSTGTSLDIQNRCEIAIMLAYTEQARRRELAENNAIGFGGTYKSTGFIGAISANLKF